MINMLIFLPIIIPLAAALLAAVLPRRKGVQEGIVLFATAANFICALLLFRKNITVNLPWLDFGINFSFRAYEFPNFIVLATAAFGFLIGLYTVVFVSGKNFARSFYFNFLFSLGATAGACLADNLVVMLFFWEALSLPTFFMIAAGNKSAFKTATKAFIILGVCDLCMMGGIAVSGWLSQTLEISRISLAASGLGGLAFMLLIIGAISKAGSMPFHTWIPDAAIDAPLPFMAILPASLEKLLGIYFLARICLDMFKLNAGSSLSILLMVIGAVTLLFAVMMALVQKNYKRLLSYHAISQVGYMILGIGTMVPAGIIGGLFHMINNALYKSCLFLTGGAVERQAGNTDLENLGGLRLKMPVTFICFVIVAASISGVPPFNGFFSKELVYDGALERGWIFYCAALLGSFFTAASFLKLGHAAFLGKLKEENAHVKEAPPAMLVPMITLALICVIFGVANFLPLKNFIQPVLGEARLEGKDFSGFPANLWLVLLTVAVLVGAVLNHLYGFRRTGSGARAVDHIHYAPLLGRIYAWAEKGYFDPYKIGLVIAKAASYICFGLDRVVDWFYMVFVARVSMFFSWIIRKLHTGNYSHYIAWSLAGAAFIILSLLKSLSM